jgi:hypothetical protein
MRLKPSANAHKCLCRTTADEDSVLSHAGKDQSDSSLAGLPTTRAWLPTDST